MRFLIAALLFLPLFAQAQVQELRSNVSLQITNPTNVNFDFIVANASTAPYNITQISVALVPTGAVFDFMGTVSPSGPTFTPDVGPNNNGVSANLVSIAGNMNILPGQSFRALGGDIDGSAITGVNVTVAFSNGESVSGPLVLSGTTWSGQLAKAAVRLYPVELTWEAPTENTDGSPYTNPAGYKIYWGSTAGTYANSKTINDPNTEMDTVTVPEGRWYFVATAFNTLGSESDHSNVAEGLAGPDPEPPLLEVLEVDPEASGTAWLIFTIRNQILFVEAGQAMSGAPCDPEQMARGQIPTSTPGQTRLATLHLVAVENVNLLPSVPNGEIALFAECSAP